MSIDCSSLSQRPPGSAALVRLRATAYLSVDFALTLGPLEVLDAMAFRRLFDGSLSAGRIVSRSLLDIAVPGHSGCAHEVTLSNLCDVAIADPALPVTSRITVVAAAASSSHHRRMTDDRVWFAAGTDLADVPIETIADALTDMHDRAVGADWPIVWELLRRAVR